MIIRIGSLISLLLLLWSCNPKERWEKQDLHGDHTVFSIHNLTLIWPMESGQLPMIWLLWDRYS